MLVETRVVPKKTNREKKFKSKVFDYFETMIYMYMYVLASLPRGHLEFEFNNNSNIQIKSTKTQNNSVVKSHG